MTSTLESFLEAAFDEALWTVGHPEVLSSGVIFDEDEIDLQLVDGKVWTDCNANSIRVRIIRPRPRYVMVAAAETRGRLMQQNVGTPGPHREESDAHPHTPSRGS